jgi:acyl-CoA synthetase (AMP-forming)/AMP-acid ligase II/acyl carrier protein
MQSDLMMVQTTLFNRRTIFEVVEYWADIHPNQPAIEYLPEVGAKLVIDYRELSDRAHRVASQLRQVCEEGDRVIMLLPPGPDFIVGFLGCLHAGVLAVPATEPKPRRLNDRLSRVVRDCSPSAVLTTAALANRIDPSVVCPPLAELSWISQDDSYNEDFTSGSHQGQRSPAVHREARSFERRQAFEMGPAFGSLRNGESTAPAEVNFSGSTGIAFLQYTSGSTSDPLGVAVSHRNLLHNLEMIRISFGQEFNHGSDPNLKGVFWLPPYHDMGLIGGILTPLYIGGATVLMPPTTFLKRPLSWLQAISQERALISGAPNFAYDLCASKIDPEAIKRLDLSSWELAFCGAEPIRAETIERFCAAFEPAGFRRQSFYPCYGLAEATLLVTGNLGPRLPVIKTLDRRELEQHHVVELSADSDHGANQSNDQTIRVVGCGRPVLDGEIVIVDPDTRLPVASDQIGEIWYRGANVASGYWNQPEKSAEVFGAELANRPGDHFLRTGDTGFFDGSQLFITGRLKEMLVIRGRNFYPQDLEATARSVDPSLVGGAVAFAVEGDQTESLVIALEIDRQAEADSFDHLISQVRTAISDVHEIAVETILLVRSFSLPRTTSGKMQRLLAKRMYGRDRLRVLARWDRFRGASDKSVLEDRSTHAMAISRSSERVPPAAGSVVEGDSIAAGELVARINPMGRHTGDPMGRPSGEGRIAHMAEEIESWLCGRLVAHGSLAPEEVTPDRPLAEFGLDSMATLQLAGEIEDHHKITLNPIAMWNYPTARHLARYLAEQIAGEFGETYEVHEQETIPAKSFEAMLREIEVMDDSEVKRRLAAR